MICRNDVLDRDQIACYNSPMTNKTNRTDSATVTTSDDWGVYGEWIWDRDVLVLSHKGQEAREQRDAWADDISDD
jgi:hypothetical protein